MGFDMKSEFSKFRFHVKIPKPRYRVHSLRIADRPVTNGQQRLGFAQALDTGAQSYFQDLEIIEEFGSGRGT